MSFHSPRSSSSKYDQRYELFKTKLKEQNQVISVRKDALNFSYEIAMKKFQTPKSEKKKKVPLIYANSYVIPQTPNAPYMPFDKTLSPAERFDKKWQYRLSSIYSNEVPIIKYEKIDFASDFKLSDSDSEKEKSGNKESSDHQENENEQQRVDDNNNNNKNEKKENSHQEKDKNENNNQENQDTTNNDINNSNNSANSEDLKIEDLEGSNNEFIEEEEEEANESQKNSLNNSNNSITKSEKDNSDEEQKTISFIAEEEEEEVDAEMTATQPNDVIDILDNQKDEDEEEEDNILINKMFGSSAIKMSDDVKEIFSFSSDDSQGNGE